jgi:hypothetical protein
MKKSAAIQNKRKPRTPVSRLIDILGIAIIPSFLLFCSSINNKIPLSTNTRRDFMGLMMAEPHT